MAHIVRKAALPLPAEVPETLQSAATAATDIRLREPRPVGFPLLFSSDGQLIEPAIAYLHEHGVQRAHTADTLRTYAEILYDWFDTLEQNRIAWQTADAAELVAYRNRMLTQSSPHGRAYSIRTINHRVRGVLRFYAWAVRHGWLSSSALVGHENDLCLSRHAAIAGAAPSADSGVDLFVLRQFATLPRPLSAAQARELLAGLVPPYDLMARWQLYTGLRVSEVLRLTVADVFGGTATAPPTLARPYQLIDVVRKGRKNGYVIAPASLLEETASYLSTQRRARLARLERARKAVEPAALFVNRRGRPVSKNRYQQVIHQTGRTCGFRATTHLLRATFACMMLARLEQLAKRDAAINPLLIVKVLMGHEHINTTDLYLRAISADHCVLGAVLDSMLAGAPE